MTLDVELTPDPQYWTYIVDQRPWLLTLNIELDLDPWTLTLGLDLNLCFLTGPWILTSKFRPE